MYPYTLHWPYRRIYTVYELVVRAWQLDSVAQLVSALHQNHRVAGSIPGRGRIRYVNTTLNVGTRTITKAGEKFVPGSSFICAISKVECGVNGYTV